MSQAGVIRLADRLTVVVTLAGPAPHRVSTTLLPGFDVRAADSVDMFLIIVGLVCGMHGALSARRRSPVLT